MAVPEEVKSKFGICFSFTSFLLSHCTHTHIINNELYIQFFCERCSLDGGLGAEKRCSWDIHVFMMFAHPPSYMCENIETPSSYISIPQLFISFHHFPSYSIILNITWWWEVPSPLLSFSFFMHLFHSSKTSSFINIPRSHHHTLKIHFRIINYIILSHMSASLIKNFISHNFGKYRKRKLNGRSAIEIQHQLPHAKGQHSLNWCIVAFWCISEYNIAFCHLEFHQQLFILISWNSCFSWFLQSSNLEKY